MKRVVRAHPSLLDRLALLGFAAFIAMVAGLAVARPLFGWDMLAYVALAEETPEMDSIARRDRAFALVRAAAPPRDWALVMPDQARRYAQVDVFDAQLGMYRIKAGYVAAARGLGHFVPTVAALRLINLIALALIAAVSIAWMAAGRFAQASFFLIPTFVIADIVDTARAATPDLLCGALSLAGLALLRRGPWPLAALAFGAATWVRPDSLVFPAAYLVVALLARAERSSAAACLAAAATAYCMATLGSGHPGWWVHLQASFPGPSGDFFPGAAFTIGAYLSIFARGMALSLGEAWLPLTVLFIGAWLLIRDRPAERPRQADMIFAALLLALAARCVVFPLAEGRLYLPTIMMLAMLVAERWAPRFDRFRLRADAGDAGGVRG